MEDEHSPMRASRGNWIMPRGKTRDEEAKRPTG